eukprot:scaffold120418_cov16-Prasinocladus_malaysianus.AAC.1
MWEPSASLPRTSWAQNRMTVFLKGELFPLYSTNMRVGEIVICQASGPVRLGWPSITSAVCDPFESTNVGRSAQVEPRSAGCRMPTTDGASYIATICAAWK